MTSRFVILAIPAAMLTCTLATYSAAGPAPAAAPEVPNDSVAAEAALDSLPGYDFTNLDEVVVTTRKPLVTSDGANLTYNVEEDPEATSNSLLEMLRKVPSVTVDGEDNIKLNGQSNFKILVNGKEDPMISGGNVSTILKSMPANSVTKIEVLNEPGAKYDAQGSGGILNLITTKKQRLEGYSASISGTIGRGQLSGSGYILSKLRNVTASLNLYSMKNLWNSSTENEQTIENLTSETNRTQRQKSTNDFDYSYTGGNFSLSWEPDTLNLFTVSANLSNNTYSSCSPQTISMTDVAGLPVWNYNRYDTSDNNGLWLGSSLSYQHTFGRQRHHIVATYYFNFGRDHSDSWAHSFNEDNFTISLPWQCIASAQYSRGHTWQIDYSNPLTERQTIEFGGKFNMRPASSLNNTLYGQTDNEMTIAPDQTSDIGQFQDIGALYASYKGGWSKFSVEAGLRYEYTHMGMKFHAGSFSDFTTILHDLVPNASVSYNLADASALRLAYNLRIWRPGLWYLNPFRNTMSTNTVQYGNPDLTSEKYHQTSLAYTNYAGALGVRLRGQWSHSANEIYDIIFLKDNIVNSTYANIGRHDNLNLQANLNWSITNSMQAGFSGTISWEHFVTDWNNKRDSKAGWKGNFNIDWNYTLPCRLRFSAYGGYGSPGFSLQDKGSSWYYYSLNASRAFLKNDMLTVSLSASNFLPAHQTYHGSQTADNLVTTYRSRHSQWRAVLSLTLRLGKLRADVKQTAASSNDDGVKAGGNSTAK